MELPASAHIGMNTYTTAPSVKHLKLSENLFITGDLFYIIFLPFVHVL